MSTSFEQSRQKENSRFKIQDSKGKTWNDRTFAFCILTFDFALPTFPGL